MKRLINMARSYEELEKIYEESSGDDTLFTDDEFRMFMKEMPYYSSSEKQISYVDFAFEKALAFAVEQNNEENILNVQTAFNRLAEIEGAKERYDFTIDFLNRSNLEIIGI